MAYDVRERLAEKLFSVFRNADEINWILDTVAVPMQETITAVEAMIDQNGFDEWEGPRLDHAGSKIGVPRPTEQEPPENLFKLFDEGEAGDAENRQGFSDEDYPSEGGYFSDENGLPLVDAPDTPMDDAGYRRLLKQKASSFRKKATNENLFNYLVAFGSRCIIDDDTKHRAVFDPVDYYALSDWEKWYTLNKGFKPAGISTSFRENMRNGDSI